MLCSECGAESPAMKTVWWEEDDDVWPLCGECYAEVADEVWIVPGAVPVFGKCRSCGEWESLRNLSDRRGGGRWDSPTGLCRGCAGSSGPTNS